MATLDEQLAALQAVLGELEANAKGEIAALFSQISMPGSLNIKDAPAVRQAMIDQLSQAVPTLAQQYNAGAAQVTSTWYDELAPQEPYLAEVPDLDTLLPAEKIIKSLTWAVNTATTVDTAMSQLQKSVQRMVYDGSRDTVVHNAKKEGVKYARHANYAGVCNWCLVMATKGTVYKSASAAVAGHDNCKCFAVPIRNGVDYKPPPEVQAAAVKYEQAVKELKADGQSASLDQIVAKMDSIDADAAAKAAAKAAPPASEYDKLPPAMKKTVQNSYSGKKNKAKVKFGDTSPEYTSLKGMGSSGYYELVYKPEHAAVQTAAKATAKADDVTNQAKWLAAEAKFNANTAIAAAAKAEAQAQAVTTAKPAAHAAQTKLEAEELDKFFATFDEPVTPVAAIPEPDAPNFASFDMQGGAGGSHGAVFMTDADGIKYLVKPQKHYKNLLDETTAKLQHKSGLPAPNVWTTNKIPGLSEASVQEFMPGGNAFKQQIVSAGNFHIDDLLTLQKNQVFDWMIANHDTHAQQWVRDHNDNLVGVDKGQAMKWLGKDKLDWEFHPNKPSGEHEPIYNTIWKMGLDGKVGIHDPHKGALHDYIQGLQAIPDDEFKAALRPFAEAAAADGKLLNAQDGFDLLPNYPVAPNDVDAFLDLAVARKNNLQNDFDALYAKYITQKFGTNPLQPPPQVIPQPVSTDGKATLLAQHKEIAGQLAHAHNLVYKSGDFVAAQDYIDTASDLYDMNLADFAFQYDIPPLPTTPEAKLLLDAQDAAAMKLVDLLDQGAISPVSFAKTSHVAAQAAKQYNAIKNMTPEEFAAKHPAAAKAAANPQPVAAVTPNDYAKLPPALKKTVQNSYSGKKNKAKAKFGPNSTEYLDLKAMGPDGYYAKVYAPANKPAPAAQTPLAQWEQELIDAAKTNAPTPPSSLGTAFKQINPETDATTVVTAQGLQTKYTALTKADLTKVGNQFSGKKTKAKKAAAGDFEGKHLGYLYSTWSKKDYWASQQLKPGGYPHPYEGVKPQQLVELQKQEYLTAHKLHDEWVSTHPNLTMADSPYYGAEHLLKWMNSEEYHQWLLDHGQTSLLGSPLGGGPKVPGAKLPKAAPPSNPPNDILKIAKINEWEAAYKKAKPYGTGFNPVKSFNPEGTLKTNIEAFDQNIGVGYLTDNQLEQVLVKLPASQKTKYLKSYANAKGQAAADALSLKVNPATNPSVISPPTSAGNKPAGWGGSTINGWKTGVTLKPGSTHTPVRQQNMTGVNSLTNPLTGKNVAVPDPTAPLGSSDNPHVFVKEDATDFKTFGALHTNQDEKEWVGSHLQPVKAYTGSSYGNYNEELRLELQKMMNDWIDPATGKPKLGADGKPLPKPAPSKKIQNIDAAFTDPIAATNEDWFIITRGASQREFQDNTAGLQINEGGYSGTVESLQPLVGKEYTQHGIGSTSITTDPAFHKHVRVIYRIPPGSKFLYVDGTPDKGYGSAISNNQGEREVLLPRDSRYKVLEVRESTQGNIKIDVVVELVEQEAL